MSKKKKKTKQNIVPLQTPVVDTRPTICGFPINVKNTNQLWNWNTLENVNF